MEIAKVLDISKNPEDVTMLCADLNRVHCLFL